tara:strand:+ start:269 stop:640 length:372 start_codon:yes stop_codon:yes gene_type:complete
MSKSREYILLKDNLKLISNQMIPGDELMPCFTKAVKIEIIIKKFLKNKFILSLKKRKIDLSKKKDWDNCEKVLSSFILGAYFTSNSVIKVLDLRKKNYLKDTKKENMFKLLKKVKYKKKIFIK